MPIQVWPRTGQRVDVLLEGTGERLLAVIDDARPPDQLHLREPVTLDGAPVERVAPGNQVTLRWTTPAGLHELPATLADFPFNRVALWKLLPLHAPVVEQRREYLRAPDALPAVLTRGAQRWNGIVIDISEGGARCVVDQPAGLALGDTLTARIEVDGNHLVVQAAVLALEPAEGPGETPGATVRLRFESLGRGADIVRRRVLEQERRARALVTWMERA